MRKGWIGPNAMIGGAALFGLVLFVGIMKSCGWTEPVAFPDYADSLATLRQSYAADSAAWRVTVAGLRAVADSALRVSRTAKDEAQRLRAARRRDLVVLRADTAGFVEAPTMVDTLVSVSAYDTLAAEADSLWSVVRADSVALEATYARIRADSLAYATLATLRANENAIHTSAYNDLRDRLAKARRGCRVLGLLPCPEVSAGYGVTLTGGQLRTGPVLAVTIPVRLR